MSSKIAKRMMSRVDEMVSRASSATKRTDLSTSKKKAAKRALLQAPSKRKGSGSTSVATSSSRSVTKKSARNKAGRRTMGLLDKARRELRGKSLVARNVSLLSYSSRGEGRAAGAGADSGAAKVGGGVASKSRKAVEHLLLLDARKAAGR
ncbi:expressed unknown protein [Ectocarpus siliculosus]|uniref:Uncharacterized protein n=1 Tax=Ectocarpus siliculosus TaxID=2880 RepID=D8LTX1_ECTSI|nr:expressed unknown protein [Ectocarpus siliculosus]|eukprot:CBN75361.1 expressed unknown protein [Ectocarpus siliculosus]